MSRSLWWRFVGVSIFFAIVLSGIYLLLVREITNRAGDEVQRSTYLFIARIVEERTYAEGLASVQSYRQESPAMPLELWVINAAGQVVASTTALPPPESLLRIKPLQVHDVISRGRFFSGAAASAVVRLQSAQPVYLLVRNPGTSAQGAFFTMALLFIVTVIGAIMLGLMILTVYLRGRSVEARQVIKDMESGNLAARFTSGRLDAIGGLMQHFNTMADEVQRLVTRLQSAELTRRQLLQELGHDLRTPLTSLRTAIDTLATHGEAMEQVERDEFFAVVSTEIVYFTRLIDDLFFIANIDEPRYRQHVARIDLYELLKAEVSHAQNAQACAGNAIQFELDDTAKTLDIDHVAQPCVISGDSYLIARLLRNVCDNAACYAASRVRIRLSPYADRYEVLVEDDGPGMTGDAITGFGQRRDQRLLTASKQPGISLGLGSVIIKTILELHGGRLDISNGKPGSDFPGMRLRLIFPAARW